MLQFRPHVFKVSLTILALLCIGVWIAFTVSMVNAEPQDYDTNGDGVLEKDEVLAVVINYFRNRITKGEVLEVLLYYFLSSASPDPTPTPTPTPIPQATSASSPTPTSYLEDVTAPELISVTLDRSQVETTEGPATIAVTVRATDVLSGVSYIQLDFESPSGEQEITISTNRLASGSFTDGTYVDTLTLPRFSESGTWRLEHAFVNDMVGNLRSYRFAELSNFGLAASFEVVTTQEDVTAPELVSVTLDRSQVDTTEGPATIAVTVRATDDLSGVRYIQLDFESPSGEQEITISTNRLASGSFTDGTYVDTLTLPRFSESGTWRLEHAFVNDMVGNLKSYRFAELSNPGLAASFEVSH